MSDQFFKGILDDLVDIKIINKELQKENEELKKCNKLLTEELCTLKNMILTYQKDYYNKLKGEVVNDNTNESVINEECDVNTDNKSASVSSVKTDEIVSETKVKCNNRNEYMKEYMRNKRKKQKEETKQLIVNKT